MKKILFFIFLIPCLANSQPVWNLKPVDFFKLPDGKSFGETVGLAIDSRQHVYVCHRGPDNLMEFDETGQFIRTIGGGLIKSPHGLNIDKDDNIWVVDVDQHLVFRFNKKGQITLVLGKINVAGEWFKSHNIPLFNRPADVAFDSDGNIYVADGYVNSRVVKFDKDGNFIKSWGIKGSGNGEFNLVHNIVIDPKNTIYIVDRENKRIQLFNTDGEYLSQWSNIGSPYGLDILKGRIIISDGISGTISELDHTGKIIAQFGGSGKATAQMLMAHAIAISSDNKIFVASTINWRVECFIPATGGKK